MEIFRNWRVYLLGRKAMRSELDRLKKELAWTKENVEYFRERAQNLRTTKMDLKNKNIELIESKTRCKIAIDQLVESESCLTEATNELLKCKKSDEIAIILKMWNLLLEEDNVAVLSLAQQAEHSKEDRKSIYSRHQENQENVGMATGMSAQYSDMDFSVDECNFWSDSHTYINRFRRKNNELYINRKS